MSRYVRGRRLHKATCARAGGSPLRGLPRLLRLGKAVPEDVDLWSRFAANLAERRSEASPETLKAAVEVAVRAAALDTGAIEGLYNVDRGFTMTVAVQGLAWQQMIDERGAGVRELFEAQLAAYELVLDAVTNRLPITEAWIRALHETLVRSTEDVPGPDRPGMAGAGASERSVQDPA